MSGQGIRRTRSRDGEEYDQLDSNIIPQLRGVEEVDGGIDSRLGQATTAAEAVAIPHRPSTSGSDQGVEESQGAAATGGKRKSRGLKHAIQKKIINRLVKPPTSSSGESSMEDPAELEERLREEMEDNETVIKSLLEEVQKMKCSEDSLADLTVELKKDIRHKEEMERLQLEKIQDLKKLLEQQNVSLSQQKEVIDQLANQHKAELDTKDRHHQHNLQQAKEELRLVQQSLQFELELAQSELKQERERRCAKLRELEDKLRAVEEGAVQTGRVTLLEPSGVPGAKGSTITQYNGQEQMVSVWF